ncbi:hypothetical protein [Stakelama tenebrarum]|uniref:Uncharacterized protein n=1 Tax=Stakelama tenebrarum TaxID=2711215 RepID=A0A6G6Y1G6_9SPHN|nr:hypothetical protein [Sphingosinithalassobacter tenebrarum]QIG78750.1 hypothetical protein G5C33_02380 [Sphingosinithalassobacter tenebrarum]
MRRFFQFGIGDIVGVALGVVGLLGSGTLAVKIAPSGWLLFAILLSIALVAVGGYSLRVYLSALAFPFARVKHDLTLRFSTDNSDTPCVRAQLTRLSEFSPRSRDVKLFDRYQLVPDAASQSAQTALRNTNHTFEVLGRGGAFRKDWQKTDAVKLKPVFGEFRALRLNFEFVTAMRDYGARIRIRECLDLPNDFSNSLEFYEVEITEPARSRKFCFLFNDFNIERASITIIHGSKKGPPKPILVTPIDNQAVGSKFDFSVRNAPIGARLRFEWVWKGLKPESGDPPAP